jgi:LmbE family N-acetylglucosaminyl deacetylase
VAVMTFEIIGNVAVILAYIGVVFHSTASQQHLRRSLRSSRLVYGSIVGLCTGFAIFNALRLFYLLFLQTTPPLYPFLDQVSQYPSVIGLSLIIVFMVRNKIVVERGLRQRRVLVIGAHPDDIEIAAGATIAKLRDQGHEIYGLILTQGEQGGDPSVRPGEARKGACFLDINKLQMMNLRDTSLCEQSQEMVQAIESLICEIRPDIILTHSAHDIHQDHQAVHEATLRAGRNQPTILCYESPSSTTEFLPSFYVEVGDYVEVKLRAIQTHWDQRDKPYMQEEQIRGKLAFRGGQAKVRYAEGFEAVRVLSKDLGDL